MQSLTQKEKMLLQDQAKHEEICIQKYSKYASQAKDQALRNMFNEFARDEQEHYNTIQGFLANSGGTQQAGNQVGGLGYDQSRAQSHQPSRSYQETSLEFTGPELGRGSAFGQRTVFGGQTPGTQQPRGYAARQEEETIYRAPQNMEGRETMRQLGWANRDLSMETGQIGGGAGSGTQDEKSMLTDMLMTEKYISGAYDSAVFESSNQQLRTALQHIQQDEQKHGEGIFDYMQQRGLYKQS